MELYISMLNIVLNMDLVPNIVLYIQGLNIVLNIDLEGRIYRSTLGC